MTLWKAKLAVAAMAAVALFSASAAKAQTCESLSDPIYIAGSSASQAIWNKVGPILYDAGVTLVYQNQGSCTGVQYIEQNVTEPESLTNGVSGTGIYFPGTSGDGGTAACTIAPASGSVEAVDVGVSDVFEATCDPILDVTFPVSGVTNFNGPTQVMLFLQPRVGGVTNNEISAEEAFYVLGFAPNGGEIAPWDQADENNTTKGSGYLAIRNDLSGTQSMIAGAIALFPQLFVGMDEGGTSGVISAIANVTTAGAPNPASYLGIAVAGNYDADRSKIRALAFRGYGQQYAWLPDSSDSTYDKQNVRQGLYPISGPMQFLYNVDPASGSATDAKATQLLGYLNGTTPIPSTTIVAAEIAASTIPDCAMGVTRTDNNYYSVVPNNRDHSCDCYFNSKVTGSTTTCAACTVPSDCPGAYCGPNGVCEAF